VSILHRTFIGTSFACPLKGVKDSEIFNLRNSEMCRLNYSSVLCQT